LSSGELQVKALAHCLELLDWNTLVVIVITSTEEGLRGKILPLQSQSELVQHNLLSAGTNLVLFALQLPLVSLKLLSKFLLGEYPTEVALYFDDEFVDFSHSFELVGRHGFGVLTGRVHSI
jgi:hypothetical protein